MVEMRVSALILSAGLSSRMKEFKPLIRLGEKTLLEHGIHLFAEAGIEQIITVLGHRADELVGIVERASARPLIHGEYKKGMFSSVQQGVAELEGYCDCFFLLPVDIPLVRPETIQQLLDVRRAEPENFIYYPKYRSRRGHPPLLDTRLIAPILEYSGKDGLRGLLRNYQNQALEVEVADPFVGLDVDTDADFTMLKKKYRQENNTCQHG